MKRQATLVLTVPNHKQTSVNLNLLARYNLKYGRPHQPPGLLGRVGGLQCPLSHSPTMKQDDFSAYS